MKTFITHCLTLIIGGAIGAFVAGTIISYNPFSYLPVPTVLTEPPSPPLEVFDYHRAYQVGSEMLRADLSKRTEYPRSKLLLDPRLTEFDYVVVLKPGERMSQGFVPKLAEAIKDSLYFDRDIN